MILDCFTFFNELDILEIRLAELYPVVDAFILVEAMHTHKGDPKPLYYAENRQRFARYNEKIRHVVVGDLPTGTSFAANWRREIGQRQSIERALQDTPDDAIILISDLDEIPRREIIATLAQQGMPDNLIYVFEQTLHYYNFNTAWQTPRWNGTRATWRGNVRALTPDGVRWESMRARSNEYPISMRVPDAGWHFSYFGDVQHILQKKRSFLHQELVNAAQLDPAVNEARRLSGADIWGRAEQPDATIGPATDLPWAARAAPHAWLRYFHPDWRPTFHEDWYLADQAADVGWLAQQAPEGAIVEIGCWEGRSAACIAQSIAPRTLHCVDHWRGNEDEGDTESTALAQEREVLAEFVGNMDRLTAGNWKHYPQDWREWIEDWRKGVSIYQTDRLPGPIAFLHLDASHDYDSVADCLKAILPFLVPHAILCGDDLYGDGVYRAVHDVLGEGVRDVNGRLWFWQKEGE